MTEQIQDFEDEKKFSNTWIIGLVIGILIIGSFVVVFVFPRGGENQPPAASKSPVASFSYSPPSPTTADTIQFTDLSSDEDGQVVSWSWNFGDGSTSSEQNPTHQYSAASTYTVTLTVTDDDGKTSHYSEEVVVLQSTQEETIFQDFESGNGTPGAYFENIWQASTEFEASIVHGGARSLKMAALDTYGGTIRINAASPTGYFDLSNATSLSLWVYDTQGNNTIQLRLKDLEGDGGSGADNYFLWSAISAQQNQWTKITWDLSNYPSVPNLDLNKIAWIELYEWSEGTYYFDDVSFVLS